MMADMSTAGDGRVERSLADRDATLAELHRDLYRWSRATRSRPCWPGGDLGRLVALVVTRAADRR
jgi:hypothetical protein